MNIHRCYTLRNLILAAVLTIGFASSALAQHALLVDLNSKKSTNLGSLGGGYGFASGINDVGQVVGASYTASGKIHAFITGPNGVGMTDLGTLPGYDSSSASGVNDAGQVVGTSETGGSEYRAFITGPNGAGMTDLGTPGGSASFAHGINDAGQVAGFWQPRLIGFPNPVYDSRHAFITGPNGVGMTELRTLPAASYSTAYGINGAGQVVGYSDTARAQRYAPHPTHAFITGPDGVGVTDLGTLGGSDSYATGINATGQVVGYSQTAGGQLHAFITGPNGAGMTDLGTLGGDSSWAYGINDAGQVVGASYTAGGQTHAFITGPNGADMTELGSVVNPPAGIAYYSAAYAINNHGQVVAGDASLVPEPEMYAMLLSGLGLIGFFARRRATA